MSAFAVFFSTLLFSFDSAAAETFYVPYSEPSTSDGQGYVALLLEHNTTKRRILNVFSWSISAKYEFGTSLTPKDVYMNVNIYPQSVTLMPDVADIDYNCVYSVLYLTSANLIRAVVQAGDYSTSYTYNFASEGYKIIGWNINGNASVIYDNDDLWNAEIPRIVWGSDSAIIDKLHELLSQIRTTDSNLSGKLDELLDEINGISENVNDIESINQQILDKLTEFMEAQGIESLEPLPDDDVGNVIDKEDELIQDTTDAENDLDFTIDTNSNSAVWSIIESFLNANGKVFGTFIGILTLGIVALLLNR